MAAPAAAAAAAAATAFAAPAPAPAQPAITQLLTAIDTGDIVAVGGALSVVEDTPDAHINQAMRWNLGKDARQTTAIQLATHGNHPEVVQLLLEHGADPNLTPKPRSQIPLILAAEKGYTGVAQVLLDSGLVDIDQADEATGGGSALRHAIRGYKPLKMVPWLIARGANVNQVDRYGGTLLHEATSWQLEVMCEWLIDAGADPEAQDEDGDTPRQLVSEGYEIAALDPVNLEKRRVWRLEQKVANRSRVLEMIDRFTGRELQERYLLPIVCGYLGWDRFASLGEDPEWLGIATREEVREWEQGQGQDGAVSVIAN